MKTSINLLNRSELKSECIVLYFKWKMLSYFDCMWVIWQFCSRNAHHNPVWKKKHSDPFFGSALYPGAPYGLENMVNKCLLQMYSQKRDEIADLDRNCLNCQCVSDLMEWCGCHCDWLDLCVTHKQKYMCSVKITKMPGLLQYSLRRKHQSTWLDFRSSLGRSPHLIGWSF